MARCYFWSCADGAAFHWGKILDRLVYREQRYCLDLWRSGLPDRTSAVGLLLGSDLFAWCRIYQGLCEPTWKQARQACCRRAERAGPAARRDADHIMNAILRGTKECSASLTISPPFHFAIHRRLHDVLPSSGIARHPQVA